MGRFRLEKSFFFIYIFKFHEHQLLLSKQSCIIYSLLFILQNQVFSSLTHFRRIIIYTSFPQFVPINLNIPYRLNPTKLQLLICRIRDQRLLEATTSKSKVYSVVLQLA